MTAFGEIAFSSKNADCADTAAQNNFVFVQKMTKKRAAT
jgi:hypothetical protein